MKSPLIHAGIALLVSIAALIGYRAWYSVIEEKSSSVATIENKIKASAETETRLAAARAALVGIEDDEAKIRGYFVPETEVVSFIERLENQGKAQGVAVAVVSVAKGGTTALPTLTFSISIQGTFDAVMRMVGAIEHAPYALTLSGLSLQLDEKKGWSADLKLTVHSVSSAPLVPVPAATTTPITATTTP